MSVWKKMRFVGLLMAVATVASAETVTTSVNAYIHCLVALSEVQSSNALLSVDLPETQGWDGETVWLLGDVPCGGVADTWYDDDGPGSGAN